MGHTNTLVGTFYPKYCEDHLSPLGDLMKQRQSHDSLIIRLIDYFLNNGLEIAVAKSPGYKKPFVIKRHAPDVMAKDPSTGLISIGLVKLCTSLEDQITQEEFQDFSKRLMKSSDAKKVRVPLVIAVPNGCQSKVREVFNKFEIPWNDSIQVLDF